MVDFGNSWSSKNSESPLVRLGVSMDPLAMLFPGLGDWKVKTSDKLQGWVSKNIAKNDPFIKLERKYGPSHWFSELRPVSDWALEKPLDATALTIGAVVGAPYLAGAFGSGAGGAGGAGMWEGAFSGTTGLSGATYGAAPAAGIPGIAGTIGGSTGAAASGLSAGQMAGLGATALGVMSPQQQQQQGAPMAQPKPRSGFAGFGDRFQSGIGALGGSLFPTQPGVDASVSKAAQDQAMMAFAAGLLAGRDKPGASFGSAFGSAYQNAAQTYSGALDNAFRNTLIRKQEEREERAEDREIQREKQAERKTAASTATRLATGLETSKANMPGYWQMVASMPEVQGAMKELGLQPPTELDPESWRQFQGQLASAGMVGGPEPRGKPSESSLMQEYGLAREQGYRGTILDYQKAIAEARMRPEVPTESERTSSNYFGRMDAAESLLGDYTPSLADYMAAQNVMGGGSLRSGIANQFLSPAGQQYYQAAADWVRAKLRKESGATIPPDEMAQEIKTYFPVPGDTPETIEQKRRARMQAQKGMRQMGGRAVKEQGAPPAAIEYLRGNPQFKEQFRQKYGYLPEGI